MITNDLLETVASHPLVTAAGWTLLHFLWQAMLIAAGVGVLLALLRSATAQVRYLVACAGLVLMTAAPVGTACWLVANMNAPTTNPPAQVDASANSGQLAVPTRDDTRNKDDHDPFQTSGIPMAASTSETDASAGDQAVDAAIFSMDSLRMWQGRFGSALAIIQPWLFVFVVAWGVGVVCLAVRLLAGLGRVWRWRSEAAPVEAVELSLVVDRLARQLNLHRGVRLLHSTRLMVPAVIGLVRPAILLPFGMATGLTTAELESILAHELAHIRRHDWIANVLQTVVETLLFYHPAVWWLSGRIRDERENCCDDLAISVCGDRVALARALARMEQFRGGEKRLSIAASGGSLVRRIRRIAGAQSAPSPSWWPAGALVLGALTVLAGSTWMTTARTVMANASPDATAKGQPEIALQRASEDSPGSESGQDKLELSFHILNADGERVSHVVINAFGHGRSAAELVRHFAAIDHDIRRFRPGISTTNMETIVSAEQASYLLIDRIDATEVFFNLPEGSGMRAEFRGEKVEIKTGDGSTTIVVTGGSVELIDAVGVIRAAATADGGAEQLVVECRESLGEVVMTIRTQRIKPDDEYPQPPVQVVMNPDTGAPDDEDDPPHRAIRYEIIPPDKQGENPMRMKMKWRYIMKRLADEATAETGLSLDELLYGEDDDDGESGKEGNENIDQPPQIDDANGAVDWGQLAEHSGLRSRLTLLTESPAVGSPIRFRLEVRNFGDEATSIDLQRYAPFRVFKAQLPDETSAPFIAMTPQTTGEDKVLAPGETITVWDDVDATSLYLLEPGQYTFLAKGGQWATQTIWRDSNSIVVEIAEGQQTPLNRLIGELRRNLPENWEVARGMDGKSAFLTHLPTDLKRDATGVQIWVTEEELADDFELGSGDRKQIVTRLGKCELGFMNVAAQPGTPEIWPDYLDHVRTAARTALTFNAEGGGESDDQVDKQEANTKELPWIATGKW